MRHQTPPSRHAMSPTRVTIVTMDYPSLNLTAEALLATSVAYVVVSVALALLLLYGVVRVAVARGMRVAVAAGVIDEKVKAGMKKYSPRLRKHTLHKIKRK